MLQALKGPVWTCNVSLPGAALGHLGGYPALFDMLEDCAMFMMADNQYHQAMMSKSKKVRDIKRMNELVIDLQMFEDFKTSASGEIFANVFPQQCRLFR
ncbi:unnamed protein product [Calypogeia fissa]